MGAFVLAQEPPYPAAPIIGAVVAVPAVAEAGCALDPVSYASQTVRPT